MTLEKQELDRITGEVEAQAALLDQAIAALEGKAAGGGTGGNNDGILPSGYTLVPAIKFTGQQVVDTGVICNQDTSIRAAYTIDANSTMYVYGVTNDAQTASITNYRSGVGGNWRFGDQRISLTTSANENMVLGVEVNKNRILRGNTASTYGTVNDFTTETTMALGGRVVQGVAEDGTMLIGKILMFELYSGEELILSFVPCMNANNVCGFYDVVSKKFHPSITDTPLQWAYV